MTAKAGTGGAAAWRTRNIGHLLFAATGAFVRDKLRPVHAAGFGLVTESHMALVQNLDLDGTRPTGIAARAGMTKQSVLELVGKAEALGLVRSRPDAHDRRAKVVVLTPDGLRMLERLRDGVEAAERRLAAAAGEASVAGMRLGLSAYLRAAGVAVGEEVMPGADAAWRTGNLGRLLSTASRVFSQEVLRTMHGAGFGDATAGHQMLLRHLDLGGSRLTELAARARTSKQAMAELIDRTESLGFVARRADPDDRRAKAVVFTPMGLALLDRFREGVGAAERRMAVVTGEAFVEELRSQLAAYAAEAQAPEADLERSRARRRAAQAAQEGAPVA